MGLTVIPDEGLVTEVLLGLPRMAGFIVPVVATSFICAATYLSPNVRFSLELEFVDPPICSLCP